MLLFYVNYCTWMLFSCLCPRLISQHEKTRLFLSHGKNALNLFKGREHNILSPSLYICFFLSLCIYIYIFFFSFPLHNVSLISFRTCLIFSEMNFKNIIQIHMNNSLFKNCFINVNAPWGDLFQLKRGKRNIKDNFLNLVYIFTYI